MKGKKFLVGLAGLGLALSLTSCGNHLSCSDSTAKDLLKKLVYTYELRSVAYAGITGNPFLINPTLDDQFYKKCKEDPSYSNSCSKIRTGNA